MTEEEFKEFCDCCDVLLSQLKEQNTYKPLESPEYYDQLNKDVNKVQNMTDEEFVKHFEMKYYKKHPWLRAEVLILNEGMEKVILNGIDITEHVKKEIGRA